MANEIERQYGAQGLHAWSVHPGIIRTDIVRHIDKGKIDEVFSSERMKRIAKNAEQGAATVVWAAVGKELEGQGGEYLAEMQVAPIEGACDAEMDDSYKCAPHAYDKEAEGRLWQMSREMVQATL